MLKARNIYSGNVVLAFASIMLFCEFMVSCRTDIDLEEERKNYTFEQKHFREIFAEKIAKISKDVNWLNLSQGSISISLAGLPIDDQYTLQLYTGNPKYNRNECYILAMKAKVNAEETVKIEYDYPIGLNYIYVSAINSKGQCTTKRVSTGESHVDLSIEAITHNAIGHYPMSYILAYETFENDKVDLDYNDAIVKMDYIRGQDYVTLHIMAAGTEYPTSICKYIGNNIDKPQLDTICPEIHSALGFDPYFDYVTKKDIYRLINTGYNPITKFPEIRIDFESSDLSATEIIPRLWAVFEEDKDNQHYSFVPKEKGHEAPQGICLPVASWIWPFEYTPINSVYDGIEDWLKSPAENQFWYSGIWYKTNLREPEDETLYCEYGAPLVVEDKHIAIEELLPFDGYENILAIKVSNVVTPGQLKLLCYPSNSFLYSASVDVSKDGIYEIILTEQNMASLVFRSGDGLGGLQLVYDGFDIDGVYIR